MDEQYFQDLFNWVSSKDSTFQQRYTFEQFKQNMQKPDYLQKMDSWIQSTDPAYFDKIKKKGQQKSALIPQVQPQVAQPTQVPLQTPEQEESAAMASRLAATSSALPSQPKPQQKTGASQFFDTGAMPGQQQMPVSESTAIPESPIEGKMKAQETQKRIKEKFPEYLNPVLESITPDLMTNSEEFVVPELKYQLEPMGFKFDEAVVGVNAVKITAPNGKSIRIGVGADTQFAATTQAVELREFIQKNTADIDSTMLKSLEKEYTAGKAKFKSEEDMKNTISDFTKKAEFFNDQKKKFLSQKTDLDRQEKFLQEATPEERNTPEYRERLNNAMKMRAELISFGEELNANAKKMAGQSQELETRVGSYVTKSEQQGTAIGALKNFLLEGLGDIFAGAFNKGVDLLYTQPTANVLNKQGKRRFVEIAKSMGMQVPEFKSDEEFDSWSKSLAVGEETREEIINKIRDERVKNIKYGADEGEMSLMEMARKGNRAIYGDKETTIDYTDLAQQGFWGGAIAGTIKSLPAMLMPGGWVARTASFYAQADAALTDEMSKDPDFKDVSESDKTLITLPIGIANAVLEEFGFRNMINSKGLLNNLVLKGLKKSTATTTAATFKEFVREEVDNMITRGLLTVTAAGLAEAETGALQQASEFAIKDIYNGVKGKEMFNTPDSFSDWMKEVAVAGAQEAVGGFILGMPSAVGAAYSKKGFLNMDDETFKVFELAANDENIQKAFVASLKNKVNDGTITIEQAKQTLNDYRKSIGLFNSLPEGLTIDGKKEAMNLLKERNDLEAQIKGKDEALVKPQKDRINAINESLTKISENAVQEQTAKESLLRTEQPELGLPQMGQGNQIASDEEKEKLKAERNVELFPEQTEFANQIGGSGSTSNLSGYNETNGVGVATYTNPDTGDVDVIMSGTSDNDYVGFVRVYENGKPTNRFTSKMSNESGNKDNFKTMITQAQGLLPEGHEYAETTSVSLDGVRVFANQLNRGYEIATDANGNPITTNVTLNAANVEGLRQAEDQAQKEGLFDDLVVNTREEFNKIKDQVTSLLPNTKVFWNQANNTVDIQLPVLRSTKAAPAVAEQATQQPTATQEATQQPAAEQKTPLQTARENRRKAKALLNSLRQGMGIDANAKAEALVAYHKSLVREALEFIKEKRGELGEWIRGFDSKNIPQLKKAWDEATGAISPIEKADQLGYSIKDVIGEDKWSKEIIEESGIGSMSGTRDILYTYSDASIIKNSEGVWMLSIDNKLIGGYRTLQIAKQAAEYYDKNPSKIPQKQSAESKTDLEIATEERRKAKALLNSLRSGVALDPTAKTRALVAYHKALVKEAIAFIKQGGKTAKAFAKKIGTKYSIAIEKAWNEATGKITPIQNPEDLGYTYEDIYDDDMSAVEGYEELMKEVDSMAKDATKDKKSVKEGSKKANKTGTNIEEAKTKAKEYKDKFEELLKKAKELVSNSAIYEEADDIQKDKLIRDVDKAFGISQKRGPSPAELFGDVTSVNKIIDTINFIFDYGEYLAEEYQKERQRYINYKKSKEYKKGTDRDVRLKNNVAKAKQDMDEYAKNKTQDVISALTDSQIYKKASPEEQKRMLDYLKKKLSKSKRSKIIPTELFRDIVDVKMITMKEMDVINERMKAFSKGAKAWAAAQKSLVKQLGDLVKKGSITNKQMESVLKKFSAVDMANETSIENFVQYMTKIFNDAEYADKINGLASKRTAAKKNILTKLGVAPELISSLSKMLAINPYLIPDSVLDDYIFLVNMLGDSSAVLNLSDKAFIQSKTNDVLNEVNNELALADTLKLVFDNYADKVIEDGKVSFSKTIAKMLKENKISEDAAELMKKYKSKIMPAEPKALNSRSAYAKVRRLMDTGLSLSQAIRKVATDEGVTEQEVTDMLDELGREKTDLIRTIRASPINSGGLAMQDERKLAKELERLIQSDGINGLDISQLETLAKVVGNINSGFISNAAQILAEKIQSVNDGKNISDAVMTAKLPSISKLYAKFKKIFVGTTVSQIMIERNPLFYIDQVLGNNKSRRLFDALFKKIAQAESAYTADLHSISDTINQIQAKVAASFNLDPAAVKLSSYKMMAYMIEREFLSNPDLKTVHSAVDFLRATIREIDTQKTRYNERDAEMLQSILNDFTTNDQMDIDKLFNSFNTQEEDAIRTLTNINNSLGDKALFTASVIRGSKINLIDNYVHRDVLYSALPAQNEMRPSTATATNNAMMPSTAAGTLEERTGAVSPLNFNVYNSVMKGARNTLLDYHLTAPVRTARMALRNAEQRMSDSGRIPKTNREIFNAIDNSFEKVLDSVLVKNFEESTLIDDVVQFISKNGYRAVLAGVSRFTGELASNIAFALLVDPQAMITAAKYKSEMLSPDAMLILKNVNSSVTQRVIPTQSISGKLIDTNIINNTVGIRDGKTRSAIVNKLQQIHNLTTKKYGNTVELVADTLISTADKLIVRPIWFGSFANEFKSITGQEVDMKMIAANDEAYMNRHKSAIQRAADTADGAVVRAAASNNPFMGILKNIDTKSTGMKGAIKSAFNNFNSFMTTFLTYEYITAKSALMASIGSGMVSRQKGVQMLAGVTTRMMVYSAITQSMGNALASMLSGVDDEEEDQEDSFWQNFGQLFTSAATSLMFGRDFGNATKTLVNAGIEEFNKEYLDMLREGDYDPYKDAIAYSIISPGEDGGIKADAKTLSRAFGSFSPVIQTSALVAKNMFGKPKKEPGAIQRQEDEMKIRVPLEIAGEAGLVPFYKDIRKATLKSIYASIKEEKKAEENKGKLLDKEWETKAKENVTALQKMLETESDPAKIKVIQDKIYEYRMNRKQHKEMLDKEEGRRKYKAQIKESLLGGYDDMQELKRYDPDLYEQNFGEGSKYYQDNKDEMEVESELNKEKKSIKDDKYDYTEPSKKGFGSRKFGTRDSEKSKFGSRKFGRD
jgi:hypothetical protein